MSSFVISLLFGIGVATFAWSKLSRATGSAHPTNLAIGAGVIGLAALLFLWSFLAWVLHV